MVISWDLTTINGDLAEILPSGKHLHSCGLNHQAIDGKTHDFDWAIFNSYVKFPEGTTWIVT